MDKMKMHTKNMADENYAALARLFPNALTETIVGYEEDGKAIVERAIDVDVLRQEISCSVVEGRDTNLYGLTRRSRFYLLMLQSTKRFDLAERKALILIILKTFISRAIILRF